MVLPCYPRKEPTLANAFLCHFEKQWLSDCQYTPPINVIPNIYRRYVDDIFVNLNSQEQLKKFTEYINTKYSNIKFTLKLEHNNILLFVDVKICCENNKLTISVYIKPTFSGVFTNFKCLYPQFTNLV